MAIKEKIIEETFFIKTENANQKIFYLRGLPKSKTELFINGIMYKEHYIYEIISQNLVFNEKVEFYNGDVITIIYEINTAKKKL